jgi:phosphoglycerate dehydrogenase-like enzyme
VNTSTRVAVCSRSFSMNPVLRGELKQLYANITFNDAGAKLHGPSLVGFLRGHDKAITALESITGDILDQLPELKVISKYGVGLDMLDLDALKRHGVKLGWFGGVNRRAVAELALMFAISLLRRIPIASREVLDGGWRQHVGANLTGKTVGVVGCGFVGKDFISLLQPFGCRILAHDLLDFPEFYARYDVQPAGLDELLRAADVVSIHLPLDGNTRNLIDERRLRLIKPTAVLVNVARGGIVDERVVKSMLQNGQLAGAGFDVFATEPPADRELIAHPNFLATPHLGGSSEEAILAMGRAAIHGLEENSLPA